MEHVAITHLRLANPQSRSELIMIIIRQHGMHTLRKIMITDKNRFLKNTYNVMVKESRFWFPGFSFSAAILFSKRKKKLQNSFKNNYSLLAPHFLIYSLFLKMSVQYFCNQKIMAVIWTKEKCLNSHGIYRQAVQVFWNYLSKIAGLFN